VNRPAERKLFAYYDADPVGVRLTAFRHRVCCYTAAVLGDVLNARDIFDAFRGSDRERVATVAREIAPGVLS